MKVDFKDLKEVVPHKSQNGCFSPPERSPINKQLKLYTDGKKLYTQFQALPHHVGWGNMIHGGILATILDEIMGLEAVLLKRMICFTKDLHITYKKPCYKEDTYTIITTFDSKSENNIIIRGEVYDSGSNICVLGIGEYRLITEQQATQKMLLPPEHISKLIAYIKEF